MPEEASDGWNSLLVFKKLGSAEACFFYFLARTYESLSFLLSCVSTFGTYFVALIGV